ncbi:TIR domain-containing protein [Streptomyces sp. ISL-22]|uniref:toll/interleukin-1 receptor domain-containing protein n=1 Tax=unclassified Streptomyces TaxID=2593676 RepID=UPI001BE5B484|nr:MULTISPECIES: TIR domain-containing protein [unclassified Streptomyces]MBT2417782.1 TIR domain-containing protein [Streptomyces sp. ISL-24]MBT2438060.1 TIR domain-containing protein [Streptomyces sp. ISL-22]
MASLFISHSSRDRVLVAGILRRLRKEGFEAVFVDFDPELGIPAGREWEPELYAALERADAVLFVGTAASAESRWCFAELALARATGKPLFPVRAEEGATHPLIKDVQWVDAIAEGEAAYARLWSAMRRRGLDPADSFDWDPGRPPYPGLSAYAPGAGQIYAAAFSPDGARIVAAAQDGTAVVLDGEQGDRLYTLGPHPSAVLSAEFSPDGSLVATGGEDGAIRLWHTAEREGVLVVQHDQPVYSARFSPDGTRVLTAFGETAAVHHTADGRRLLSVGGHMGDIVFASFSPDGSRIVTASSDMTAWVSDAVTGEEVVRYWGHNSPVQTATFSPDGSRVVTCTAGRGVGGFVFGRINIWAVDTGNTLVSISAAEDESVLCADFSPDGTRVVASMGDHTVRVWDAADGRHLLTLSGHTQIVRWAHYSPDGLRLVTASDDGTARVWDAVDGRELVVLDGRGHRPSSALFSPDGTRIVTASTDGSARVWDAAAGAQVARLWHGAPLIWAEFTPDGTHIVTSGGDGAAVIWRHYGVEELISLARTRVFRTATDAERREYGLPVKAMG